ncbi:MAG: YraN family protein [Desulfobacterales bacterium]|nr:YraN family protein [Desulfobacterales bacterium]
MTEPCERFWQKGEDVAVRHMQKCGYKILARNYRTPIGEIDIVAKDKDTLVFAEVKTRRSDRYGSPKSAVTPTKQRKISMTALYYLKGTPAPHQKARFDVISVRNQATGTWDIEIIKNAFELAYP